MRIVIDMQGAQTESRFRGIGRYTLSFAQAVVRNRGEHDIILALNGLFPDTIEGIRAAFDHLLPQEKIRVWDAPGPVREVEPGNDRRRETAELIREAFLSSLQPDAVHVSSLFEGYCDDAVTSIGRFDSTTPVSVILYDLIPMLNPEHYLKPNPQYARYYLRKIEHLRKAAVYLAISEFSRQEGQAHLGSASQFVNVSTATETHFQALDIDSEAATQLRLRFGLTRPFILYTGGTDERKNLPRLIQAFASLPGSLRESHQLLLAGKMCEGTIGQFTRQAKAAGLKHNDLCFTGYVTDQELVHLYNLCQLFVFPSWHEGFGLPALEAMACGAPVIAANTSSLPEVIGLDEALFDPLDVTAIAAKIVQALEDHTFRATLRDHGLNQARRFSWDESAKRAFAAWESAHASHGRSARYIDRSLSNVKLIQALAPHFSSSESGMLTRLSACIAKNLNAGIQRQLMLDVSELSQRDAATGVQRVVRSYLNALLQSPPAGYRVEPVYATRDEGYRYARTFTQRFLSDMTENLSDEPVQWQRGDVFFGLDMQHHVQLAHQAFYQHLRQSGVTVKFLVYDLLPIQLAGLFKDGDAKDLHEQWLAMIAATDGAICISKATAEAYDRWIDDSGIRRTPNFQMAWVHIGGDIVGSKPSQGIPEDAPAVLDAIRDRPSFLCVATLEPRKGQQQIVEAIELLWDQGLDVNLVLVGQQGWQIEALAEKIRNHSERNQRLFWLQGISDEYLEKVYAAGTCLIAASLNEGFGLPLIEAARHRIPIIVRDIPVFREVAADSAFYFTGETPPDLAASVKEWLTLYLEGDHPRTDALRWSTWQESAEKLKAAIVHENHPCRQLLVDISELVQRDSRTGIQRVVRSILREWLNHPPQGYRVEPVYATLDHGYRYAHIFTQEFLGFVGETLRDQAIDYAPGDFFVGLDLQPQVVAAHRSFYSDLRRRGVCVKFVLYDLLGILMPQYFPPGTNEALNRWLEIVVEGDGVVCISKAVADELSGWLKGRSPKRQLPLEIKWFHLGADVANSVPSTGLPDGANTLLDKLSSRKTFLMVGTLEPRKGYAQVLGAFDQLWESGQDANLVIVGKQGWMVDSLVDRILAHPELGHRLFWLDGISDEYLEKIYGASTCLIAASYGEGFGLPLIEAAHHNLSIIARGIPIFREVAGEHSYYFIGETPNDLVKAVKSWQELNETHGCPNSLNISWQTWAESARQLSTAILNEEKCKPSTLKIGESD